MRAYINVLDHPFYAVSSRDGAYTIAGLPPGAYTVEFWHEGLVSQQQDVTVQPHGKATANLTFKGR
jgi:hypothetical protein